MSKMLDYMLKASEVVMVAILGIAIGFLVACINFEVGVFIMASSYGAAIVYGVIAIVCGYKHLKES